MFFSSSMSRGPIDQRKTLATGVHVTTGASGLCGCTLLKTRPSYTCTVY